MSDYNSLKAAINANIRKNGRQEITGQVLNGILRAMVDALGAGFTFRAVADPDTDPGSTDSRVFYIATIPGNYEHMGGIEIEEGEVAILKFYDDEWHKEPTGLASQAALESLGDTLGTAIGEKMTFCELWCDGDKITRKNDQTALAFSEVKDLMDDPSQFVALKYIDVFWMLPQYDDEGGAIIFTGVSLMSAKGDLWRVAINEENQISDYSIVIENQYLKTDDLEEEQRDNFKTYPTTQAVNAALNGKVDNEDIDIPCVYLTGAAHSQLTTAKNEVAMELTYSSRTKKFHSFIKIKYQGNSTLNWAKKNYTIKLFQDEERTIKDKVEVRKEWGGYNKYVLKANWIDYTQARNVVGARLWADVVRSRSDYDTLPEPLRNSPNQGAIDGFLVKVYVNGIYQGRYTWNYGKDDIMFGKTCEGAIASENYSSGCFRALSSFRKDIDWTVEYPDELQQTHKDSFNAAIQLCMAKDDEAFKANIGNYLDINSLIDYEVFGRVTCHFDGFGKNQIFLNYGDKWYASAYDMDTTFGMWWQGNKIVSSSYKFQEDYESAYHNDANGNLLYYMLDRNFKDEIYGRYKELRNGVLSVDNLIDRFEKFMSVCPKELAEEDYASTTANGAYTGIPSKSITNIQQLRKFIVERCAYCDAVMEDFNQGVLGYIKTNGRNYFNVGPILKGENSRIVVNCWFDETVGDSANWVSIAGVADNATTRKFAIERDNQGRLGVIRMAETGWAWMFIPDIQPYTLYTVDLDGSRGIYVNGEAIVSQAVSFGDLSGDCYIAAVNSGNGRVGGKNGGGFCSCEVYNTSGEKVHHYVLTIDKNSTIRLLDKVTGVYYETLGDGAFTEYGYTIPTQ